MGTSRASAWAALVLVTLLGCAHSGKKLPPPKDEPFRIGREDVLDIAVWRDPDLSRTLQVRPDGFISMPIIGELKAEGYTPTQLAEEIAERLNPYVQSPKVTVIVREVHSSRIFVTGEVIRPGTYPLRGRMSLLQAIALAGGFTPFASSGSIRVIRGGAQGQAIPVSYGDLVADDDDRVELFLEPGDTVVVP